MIDGLLGWGREFFLAFVPLFFAIDALGIVPMYISLTNDVPLVKARSVLRDAVFTALAVASVFLLAGKAIFHMLGITADDFRIGGGLVLLLIAIMDLLFSNYNQRRDPGNELSVVPLGIPLIVGPGALTTVIMLVDRHGYLITIFSLIVNLLLVWVTFANSKWIVRVMGKSGAKAFGKVASLFLAAIAVMMIRVGITNTISGG